MPKDRSQKIERERGCVDVGDKERLVVHVPFKDVLIEIRDGVTGAWTQTTGRRQAGEEVSNHGESNTARLDQGQLFVRSAFGQVQVSLDCSVPHKVAADRVRERAWA